jgi:hypothetical protein
VTVLTIQTVSGLIAVGGHLQNRTGVLLCVNSWRFDLLANESFGARIECIVNRGRGGLTRAGVEPRPRRLVVQTRCKHKRCENYEENTLFRRAYRPLHLVAPLEHECYA